MNTHTPGPWTLRRHATNHQTLTGATVGLIADIHRDEDARLIAAAPELLAAIQALDDAFSHYCEGDPSDDEIAALQVARAAIHKATGGVA